MTLINVQVRNLRYSAFHFDVSHSPLRCKNNGAGGDLVSDPGSDGCRCTRELGEGSSWVVGVTLRA